MVGKPRGHRMKNNSARRAGSCSQSFLFPSQWSHPSQCPGGRAPVGTAHCLGLPEMPRAVPLQSCLAPLHPCTPAAQSRARKGMQRGWGCSGRQCGGCGQPTAGTIDLSTLPPSSTRRQDTRSPTLAPTQRLSPGEALPPVSQGGIDKAPELPARSGPEPQSPSPCSPASPPSSPNDWPQERSLGGHSDCASPRGPVPTTLPGLRHAPWQGPRGPLDSPDGSPLTPVPTQMPWLVASPEPPQSSPTPAFPVAASYDTNGPTQPPLPEKRHLPGSGQQPGPWSLEQASPPTRGTSHHVTFAPLLPDNTTQPPGIRALRADGVTWRAHSPREGHWGVLGISAGV